MKVTVPIWVQETRRARSPAPTFTVRPLFAASPNAEDELLGRATTRLVGQLRKLLDGFGRDLRHDALAHWCFAPPLQEHKLNMMLHLRRSTLACSPIVVTFEALGRTIGLVPSANDLYFEINAGESVAARASEALTSYLRMSERDGELISPASADLSAPGWVSSLELDVVTNQTKKAEATKFMFLGGPDTGTGREELENVGRCLNWLYPEELDRATLRDEPVDELTRLLHAAERRPVLLVGPRGVGKTAVVHEYVFRHVDVNKNAYANKENVWLLAPQRLISGMMYVGQWEARLLAILDEAKKNDHVLYFDDLLGLYYAGQSRDSDMSVAQVLRPFIERRDVRILAEMTPDALRVLRERDRGMADLFHVVPVPELPPAQNRRILINSMRQLEARHACRFEIDALPTAIDLLDRHVRDAVMPGKAATLLRRLAVRSQNKSVDRDVVLDAFHANSGLSVRFLDDRQRLQRKTIVDALSQKLIGQPRPVEAMADVIAVAKARLNDPTRPLMSMLLLGPTGVGKTQAAKALAEYLFGDVDRLVRVDMNEYVDPSSVWRLVGNAWQPEGVLTSAIRRQPFSVVLFDEIEKADPDVFDLLLQVLGEGRLTDAMGRRVDFSNTIILFTSNLGVREVMSSFGLRPAQTDDEARRDRIFVEAAERHFRPEFFNRIDRIVPFRALGRDEVRQIATRLIQEVFSRGGLVQRKCVLQVEPAAMERIVDRGFDPDLGARALKRAVEKQLTAPIAARLAAMPPGAPTLISLSATDPDLDVSVHPLTTIATTRPPAWLAQIEPIDVLHRLTDALERIEDAMADAEPVRVLTQGTLDAEHYRYLVVRDQADRLRAMLQRAFDQARPQPRPRFVGGRANPRAPRPAALRRAIVTDSDAHAFWHAFAAADEVNAYLADAAQNAEPIDSDDGTPHERLIREAAMLNALATSSAADDRLLLHIRVLASVDVTSVGFLRDLYKAIFDPKRHFSATRIKREGAVAAHVGATGELLLLEMPGIAALFAGEIGTHLFLSRDGGLVPTAVASIPMEPDESVEAALARHTWPSYREPPAPIVRIYGSGNSTLDLATGLMTPGPRPTPHDLFGFITARLALPVELTEDMDGR